jgi:hypothetical protein
VLALAGLRVFCQGERDHYGFSRGLRFEDRAEAVVSGCR